MTRLGGRAERFVGWAEARSTVIVATLIGAGVMMRAGYNALRPGSGANAEVMNVAVALASGRGFADAYGPGTGPTAHLAPLNPAIGGAIYSIFGTRSIASEMILATWSIGLAMATYLLLYRAFGRMGVPRIARLAALATGCLLPVYIAQEAVDFRLWDGGLTAALMAALIDRLAANEARTNPTLMAAAPIAVIGALLLFVNAPVGVAAVACCLLFAVRRLSFRTTAAMAATGLLVVLCTVGPWTIRNYRQFHEVVPLRSNGGLELAIGMNPASLDANDRRESFERHFVSLHPYLPTGRAAMIAAGGEIPYSRRLGHATKDWIQAHPGTALKVMMLHVREQFAPEPWQFSSFGSNAIPPSLRSMLAGVISIVGLTGLLLAAMTRRGAWLYPTTMVVAMSILTAPFQPVPRYTYLYYPIMLFAAANLLAMWWQARRANMGLTPSR